MVLRVALAVQAAPLDGVGEDHGRAGVVDRRVGVEEGAEVVAAEVAHRAVQGVVVEGGDEPFQGLAGGAGAGQAVPQLGGGAAQQALVLRVAHGVQAGAQGLAARSGEEFGELLAVLEGEDLPAGRLEHAGEAFGGEGGDDAVQGLAVEVDDPDDLAEPGDHRVLDRLPAGALVEFGVAEEGVLASGAGAGEAALDVAAGEGAPDRGGGADADGAGGVVDRVGVLGAARVALEAAEGAEGREGLGGEFAEEVVDGVQGRGGVRLDRDPVVGGQFVEPERRHDRHHRGAGGLVAADLQSRGVRADTVGVVDGGGGEPEHALLDLAEGGEQLLPAGTRRRRRVRDHHRTSGTGGAGPGSGGGLAAAGRRGCGHQVVVVVRQ